MQLVARHDHWTARGIISWYSKEWKYTYYHRTEPKFNAMISKILDSSTLCRIKKKLILNVSCIKYTYFHMFFYWKWWTYIKFLIKSFVITWTVSLLLLFFFLFRLALLSFAISSSLLSSADHLFSNISCLLDTWFGWPNKDSSTCDVLLTTR